MPQTAAAADRRTLSVRPGASLKLLASKAAQAAQSEPAADAIEDSFPAAPAVAAEGGAPAPAASLPAPVEYIESTAPGAPAAAGLEPAPPAPLEASVAPAAPAPAVAPSALPAWSSEDERTLRAMLARRKAAGYQRRGRDVSGQLIRLGDIAPNPGTVVAVIVGLVAGAGGAVTREKLVALMAGAAFPNAKAQPTDKGWCQGYVAGAVRSGFLAVAGEPAAGESGGEPSPTIAAGAAA